MPMDSQGRLKLLRPMRNVRRCTVLSPRCPNANAWSLCSSMAEGYALKDIATFLDVPVTTVKKRLYDGRQRLKDELIDVMRDTLQEQRPSIPDTFPAKIRLLIAARLGDIDSVKELLARSPMLLNMQTEQGEARYHSVLLVSAGLTALHEAAMHNHAQLAQVLCEYGANCNARTSSGLTPLHEAVLSHCHETAAVLLTYGANSELPLSSRIDGLAPGSHERR